MKRISFFQFPHNNEYEVFLFDTNSNDIELFNKLYFNHTQAINTIESLITEYNLQPNTPITNYVFDSNGYTKEVIKETITDFLQ